MISRYWSIEGKRSPEAEGTERGRKKGKNTHSLAVVNLDVVVISQVREVIHIEAFIVGRDGRQEVQPRGFSGERGLVRGFVLFGEAGELLEQKLTIRGVY